MAGSDDHAEILYEEVFRAAKKLGVGQQLSDDMARMVDDGVRRRCGGARVYVNAQDNDSRNKRLYLDYLAGLSWRELVEKYQLSKSSVFRIVSCMRSS